MYIALREGPETQPGRSPEQCRQQNPSLHRLHHVGVSIALLQLIGAIVVQSVA